MSKKVAALEALRPDLAVIAEALPPDTESNQLAWFPSNASRLGIQVRAFGAYTLRRLRRAADLPNCVVPLRVTHAESASTFDLLAVWVWPAPSYTRAFLNGLGAYHRVLRRGPAVVAGDFNGNPMFDRTRPRAKWWTNGFAQLDDAGLVSAYHAFHRVDYGDEAHPTHHFLRKPERPFHIDFCFVPQAWAQRRLEVQVPRGAQWRALSDHFPVVVDTEG